MKRRRIASTVAMSMLVGGAILSAACTGEPAAPAPPAPPANSNAAAPTAPVAEHHGAIHSGPLEGADLAKAEGLFKTNCQTCHTASGKGDPHHKNDGIPDFTNAAWQAAERDEALFASIKTGHGNVMPAFAEKLSDDEIRLLVHYVREFPTRSGAAEEQATDRGGSRPAAKPKPAPKAKQKPAPKKDDHGGHHDHHP